MNKCHIFCLQRQQLWDDFKTCHLYDFLYINRSFQPSQLLYINLNNSDFLWEYDFINTKVAIILIMSNSQPVTQENQYHHNSAYQHVNRAYQNCLIDLILFCCKGKKELTVLKQSCQQFYPWPNFTYIEHISTNYIYVLLFLYS